MLMQDEVYKIVDVSMSRTSLPGWKVHVAALTKERRKLEELSPGNYVVSLMLDNEAVEVLHDVALP